MLPAPRAAVSRVFEPRLCEIGRRGDQTALAKTENGTTEHLLRLFAAIPLAFLAEPSPRDSP